MWCCDGAENMARRLHEGEPTETFGVAATAPHQHRGASGQVHASRMMRCGQLLVQPLSDLLHLLVCMLDGDAACVPRRRRRAR